MCEPTPVKPFMRPQTDNRVPAFKCSSHSELHRPQTTATALAASAETFNDHAATSYGSKGQTVTYRT